MPALDCVSNFWNYCPRLFGLTAPSTRGLALFDISFNSHGDSGTVGAWMCMSPYPDPKQSQPGMPGRTPVCGHSPPMLLGQLGFHLCRGSAATGHCACAREHILLHFPSPSRLLMALKGGSASTEAFPCFLLSLCSLACSSSPNPEAPGVAPGEEVAVAEQSLDFPAEEQPLLEVIPVSVSIHFCTMGMN